LPAPSTRLFDDSGWIGEVLLLRQPGGKTSGTHAANQPFAIDAVTKSCPGRTICTRAIAAPIGPAT